MVFRPRRHNNVSSGVAVVLSLAFVAAGGACFLVVGLHPFSFAFSAFGIIATAAAIGSMFTRTIVTADGITKCPTISGGFRIQWRDVDSWEQLPRRSDDAPCVRFRLRGTQFPRVIFDYEVEEPGLEAFLRFLRQNAAEKEATKPCAHPNTGNPSGLRE
jgi:hypothetical protein